jgi:hypothetical protein
MSFIENAKNGEAVYISDLRSAFTALSASARSDVECIVETIDGRERYFEICMPRTLEGEADKQAFIREYFYASLYNIISALGARAMRLYGDLSDGPTASMLASLDSAFSIGAPMRERRGYGAAINVTDRIVASLGGADVDGAPERFHFIVGDLRSFERVPSVEPRERSDIAVFKRPVEGLRGRLLCGMDVGGTDIKAVAVRDGAILCYKEHDWFPAAFGRIRELIDPIVLVVGLLRAAAALDAARESGAAIRKGLAESIEAALDKDAPLAEVEKTVREAAIDLGTFYEKFDGIGLSFPDVVIKNKIVGGETYKTRGVRNNPTLDYETEFCKLTNLNELLCTHAKRGDGIRIINDGPMAAYTAAVEMAAFSASNGISSGIFAHTLGTELGTGWVRGDGEIPDIPLEVYNFIIDLGSWPARQYEPDDVRSINNFNTSLPGTLQKYTSQNGVFRLAERCFSEKRPDLLAEAFAKEYLRSESRDGREGLFVPTEPADMRKSFLEYCLALPEKDGDPAIQEVFRQIGEYLAITTVECDYILNPETRTRFIFGRLVKNATCFELICEGARRILPKADFRVADGSLAETPLMRQLAGHKQYTVAQFAQAVGAAYFCNARDPSPETPNVPRKRGEHAHHRTAL